MAGVDCGGAESEEEGGVCGRRLGEGSRLPKNGLGCPDIADLLGLGGCRGVLDPSDLDRTVPDTRGLGLGGIIGL